MPSSSPLSRCQAAYIRFYLALSKRFNDQLGLVYMLAFALVIFLGVSLVKYSAATQTEVGLPDGRWLTPSSWRHWSTEWSNWQKSCRSVR